MVGLDLCEKRMEEDNGAAIAAIVNTWLTRRGYEKTKEALQKETGL